MLLLTEDTLRSVSRQKYTRFVPTHVRNSWLRSKFNARGTVQLTAHFRLIACAVEHSVKVEALLGIAHVHVVLAQ